MGRHKLVLVAGWMAVAGACGPSPSQQVAIGVARLTIRNTGAVATLLSNDTTCGFKSPAVLQNPTLDGDVGSTGTFTLHVVDCTLDLPEGTVVSEDCTGGKVQASGKVTVSATRAITGSLTGVATNPVVPSGPDSVTITLEKVLFENFKVTNSKSTNVLTNVTGGLKAVLKPRLAVSATNGACAIATPNTEFVDVHYNSESGVRVQGDSDVDATVFASNLEAFNGRNGASENQLKGSLEMLSKVGLFIINPRATHDLGTVADTRGLDPDYSASDFQAAYACSADLASPESFVCADLKPRLADGAARLSAKLFGTVASMVDKDTTCGFSSMAAAGTANLSGAVGSIGTLSMSITNCTITLDAETELQGDCAGSHTVVRGQVVVSGSKVVAGRLTGSPTTPVIPMADNPATLALTLTFSDFRVGTSGEATALTAKTGQLMGTLQPRVALSNETGACSITSPIARFSGLAWSSAVLAVTSAAGTFDIPVTASNLNAVNGTWDSDSNSLSGTLNITGIPHTVPSDGMGLDPAFTQAAFDTSWTCTPHLVMPPNHSCGFVAPLAQGVARLTPRTVGAVVAMINANASCGFKSTSPTVTTSSNLGADGQTVTQTISNATPCTIPLAPDTVISQDCDGVTTMVGGSVSVSGTKTVTGFLTGDPAALVIPTSRDPATFNLTMNFTNFKVATSASTSSLLVKSGSITASVTPRTALDTTTGACSISTPVVHFSNVVWNNAQTVLVSDGRSFSLILNGSNLDAQNGTRDTVSNKLTGTITVDGSPVPLPFPGGNDLLDPAFDQAAFDHSYACAPNQFIPSNDATCSFRQALAGGVAALLVKNAAVATKLVDGSPTCGFQSTAAAQSTVVAPANAKPGDAASLSQNVAACVVGSPGAVIPSCVANVGTQVDGSATLTGMKSVGGVATGNASSPVAPVTRTAGEFNFTAATFNAFAAYDSGTAVPATTRMVMTGSATMVVDPVGGESSSTTLPGLVPVYSVGTPVARVRVNVSQDMPVTLTLGPKTFKLTVGAAAVDAFNGSFGTNNNNLSGSITLDGQPITFPAGTKLNTGYMQAAFDDSYRCTPDLKALVPPAGN